jgi:preprotein translocase subunit SecA
MQFTHADFDGQVAQAIAAGADAEAIALALQTPPQATGATDSLRPSPAKGSAVRVGRNDACPCGSGKKFKLCHGKLA